MRLDGKAALVVGVGDPLGAAVASAYTRAGARVVCADPDPAAAQRVAHEIAAASSDPESRVLSFGVDRADRLAASALISFVQGELGGIDVLHNHTTSHASGRVADVGADAWDAALAAGLTGPFLATRAALPAMLAQGGGAIVNTVGVAGLAGDYGRATDSVVHAGVLNLTRTTAIDYARKGVRCNAVCVGPLAGEPDFDAGSIPMGRFAELDELTAVAVFLASEEASFITGACFVVDGGLGAHTNFAALGHAAW